MLRRSPSETMARRSPSETIMACQIFRALHRFLREASERCEGDQGTFSLGDHAMSDPWNTPGSPRRSLADGAACQTMARRPALGGVEDTNTIYNNSTGPSLFRGKSDHFNFAAMDTFRDVVPSNSLFCETSFLTVFLLKSLQSMTRWRISIHGNADFF